VRRMRIQADEEGLPPTPILAVTHACGPSQEAAASLAGFDGVLAYPVSRGAVEARLRALRK